jgi:hypothetical protein
MKHLITISIILGTTIIPYLISRYLIFKKKVKDISDYILFWLIPVFIIFVIFVFIIIYQVIYKSL